MPLKIRISKLSIPEEQLVPTILSFTKNPDESLIVQEHEPKDHYHVYLADPCLTAPTVRLRLAAMCPTKNNDSYSVSASTSDWLGYQGYLVKYEDTTILHQGNLNVDELRDYYKKVSTSPDTQKRTEYTGIFNFVMEQIDTANTGKHISARDITVAVIKYYQKEQKIFHKAHMAQLVNTIYYQLQPENSSFVEQILLEAQLPADVSTNQQLEFQNYQLRQQLKQHLKFGE